MNHSETRVADTRVAHVESGLWSAMVADKAARCVRLLIGLTAGFGMCVTVENIWNELRSLGRADARLVLDDLKESHEYAYGEVQTYHPQLMAILQGKLSGT